MLQRIINHILHILQTLYKYLYQLLQPPQKIIFDNGPTVAIHHKIGEGAFSLVFAATEASRSRPQTKYALKRIICGDEEMFDLCRKEVNVHRRIQSEHGHNHANLLYLFHVKFVQDSHQRRLCYMLFPLISGGSLRNHVTRRKLLSDDWGEVRPWTERQVLTLFRGVLEGVSTLHRAGYAHCDVKLENVLLDGIGMMGVNNDNGRGVGDVEMNNQSLGRPIVMDFGSARDIVVKLVDRNTVLRLCEDAAQYSTISYRAPELFEGGCRHGPLEASIDGKIDVWSCGCLLYGMMYGTSPFEMEFRHDGSVKVVECTHLRVLGGKLPHVPAKKASLCNYGQELLELIEWILTVDRTERPTIDEVCDRVEIMLKSTTTTSTRDFV
jgi:serine/threonine kinase 16